MVRALRNQKDLLVGGIFYDSEYFADTNCRNQSIFYYLLSKRPFQKQTKFQRRTRDMRLLPFHVIYLSFNIWRFRLCHRNRPLSKVEMGQHEKLPGTLNTQCSTGSRHGIVLHHCHQRRDQDTSCLYYLPIIGAYLGPRFVVKLPEKTIKLFVGIGLVIAALLILQDK